LGFKKIFLPRLRVEESIPARSIVGEDKNFFKTAFRESALNEARVKIPETFFKEKHG
jgi:hypothetical protein